ncbi:shikimate kinase [Facklamia miroungae]|uniref:Shikimate kinase n=1 Tax=Facklamia miroungae TaxID=120956 RepID=A0A1G7RV09_9LACT|nr:shikimate kinase [Facklamia miroungae]NKZ29266.1 AAA family ATPase [Facklamia miroungae]SDG14562.1 shikimate dehydrogenase [Facklamia miroungae]
MFQTSQKNKKTTFCGLIGRKLGHSYSQSVHQRIGNYPYHLIELEPHQLEDFLLEKNYLGLNVTIPYKEAVLPYLDSLDPLAKAIGSVNTIVNKEGKLKGYNTDYAGLDFLLKNNHLTLTDKNVLILGSGGSAKMIGVYAKNHGCQRVSHLSIRQAFPPLSADHQEAQVIFNATPVGMYPNNQDLRLNLTAFPQLETVVDLIYNPLRTSLVLQAKSQGIQGIGGLDMLIAQAFFASQLFTDTSYPTDFIHQICQSYWQGIENLVFIGMPGVGKTTLGKKLADQLGRPFLDTDQLIEAVIHQPISEYISKVGEKSFRDLEEKIIHQVTKENGQVIATGGGAILSAKNRHALKQNGRLILLERPLEELSRKSRPLSASLEQVKRLWDERKTLYRESADLIIPVKSSIPTSYQEMQERLIKHAIISPQWTQP